jgi:hypothetical protein
VRPFPTSPIWLAIDWLGDHTAIPESWSIHFFSLQIGFFDMLYSGAFNLLRFWYRDTPSLFMNGVVFLQIRTPFWVGIQVRPFTARFFQCGIGWKGNGRLAVLFRFQTDESAATGMDGPNFGQAKFMDDGTK